MGQFILSGSQNFHLMENITQSLAGRVAISRLFTFDFQEMRSGNLLETDYLGTIVRGFYPAIYDRDIQSRTFYANYLQTYLQRDVSSLISVRNIRLFQNFIGLCATRAGQMLNLNSIAIECGISQPTARSWLSALENSYIIFTLQPFYQNFSKRIVKTPKLYFYDTGLLCYLLKISSAEQILNHPVKGCLFENMMIPEYVKRMYHNNIVRDIWFWRDSSGHEIDLIIQEGSSLHLTEIKSTQTIMSGLFKELLYFEKISKYEKVTKTLVYAGKELQTRSYSAVIPWSDFGK